MKKKTPKPEPAKKPEPDDKKTAKLVREVEAFNPDFVARLKKKGLIKG